MPIPQFAIGMSRLFVCRRLLVDSFHHDRRGFAPSPLPLMMEEEKGSRFRRFSRWVLFWLFDWWFTIYFKDIIFNLFFLLDNAVSVFHTMRFHYPFTLFPNITGISSSVQSGSGMPFPHLRLGIRNESVAALPSRFVLFHRRRRSGIMIMIYLLLFIFILFIIDLIIII